MPLKRHHRTVSRLLALLAALALVGAACGGSDDERSAGGADDGGSGDKTGGEMVDLGVFIGDPPEHIDPALNSTLDAYQVINVLYDGLTDVDASDPANPKVKPLMAEKVEPNADASVWTFTIKKGLEFSNGEPVLPSSFSRAWERASNPDFAGDYSYLFNFIKGGKEKLKGTAKTLEGLAADDDAMTLTVTMASPYSNFDMVSGFQIFSPMPKAVEALKSQNDWENGLMVGNGAFKLAKARNDQEIVLVRNDKWAGDVLGNKRAILDKITFRISKDVDSAYNSFEAGEAESATVPPGRVEEAKKNYGTTLDTQILGSYHYELSATDPAISGPKNLKLRQAVSQAINRAEINEAAFDSIRTVATGITPPGIPGFKKDICKFCSYDVAAAKQAFADWKSAGNSQTGPLKIQFNADNGHEPVVAIIVDNLKAVGIEAQADPRPTETYFSELADGICRLCRSGWFADYPTYDNFMYDLFHKDAIGGNNHGGYDNAEFNSLVDKAKATVDKDDAAALFNQAEDVLLNTDMGVVPLLWYRGDFVFNEKKLANFQQTNLGLVLWDQIRLK